MLSLFCQTDQPSIAPCRRSLRRSSSSASCARYQYNLRAPCAAVNPLVVRRTIVSKLGCGPISCS
jgi:hypothetical protein